MQNTPKPTAQEIKKHFEELKFQKTVYISCITPGCPSGTHLTLDTRGETFCFKCTSCRKTIVGLHNQGTVTQKAILD